MADDLRKADPVKAAAEVRAALSDLNVALVHAAACDLHVELHSIHAQSMASRYGHNIYSVTIEKREPM